MAALVIILISGCACPQIDPKYKLVMQFDNYMIPLGKAVDVVADELPLDAENQVIFLEVVRRSGDPGLLKPFNGYILRARIGEDKDGLKHGLILLCTPDGKEGIIEDVTCTARPDTYRPSGSPCMYFLDVKLVCSAP